MTTYAEAFRQVMEEARKISRISDIERWDNYEALKAKVYELLNDGRTDLGKVADEAISWLRQEVQIHRSEARLKGQE